MKKLIKVTVKYPAGHSYDSRWERGEYHCPSCGSQTVFEENGPGDYYHGADYACIACGFIWTMQEKGTYNSKEGIDKQVIDQLKEAVENDG